ncbi:4Fe-4S dicluster domain-containing protein [Roseburia hominis]
MSGRIKFDQKKCVGCFACYVACISAHYGPEEEGAQSFRSIRKITVPEEGFQKNVCPGCIHCGRCIKECDRGALYRDEETGLVLTYPEKCDGCGKCMAVCPNQVISLDLSRKVKKCDGCVEVRKEGRLPACVSACLTGALTFEEK